MFARGFKTWCEELAIQVRRELSVAPTAPLDPLKLAEALEIPVLKPSEIRGLTQEVCQRLLTVHSDSWSALTISHGDQHVVIYNPSHSPARQRSDLTHELAHILLGHKPTQLFIAPQSGAVLRAHDQNQEAEASWLAGCLLLPRSALLSIRSKAVDDKEACSLYGISRDLLRYRINVSGVDIQLKRVKSFHR